MKKSLIIGLVFLFFGISFVTSITDEELNNFYLNDPSFSITPIWASEFLTSTGGKVTLSLIKLDWEPEEQLPSSLENPEIYSQELRFYGNYNGILRQFSDFQNITLSTKAITVNNYPSTECIQRAPDGSCGVEHIDFGFICNSSILTGDFCKFNLEVESSTGLIKEARFIGYKEDVQINGNGERESTISEQSSVQLNLINQGGVLTEESVFGFRRFD